MSETEVQVGSGVESSVEAKAQNRMADTTIYLEIEESKHVPTEPDDTVPWRIAMVPRPASERKSGHRLKRRGYYYRFTGGNTKWDNGEPIGDGDFEFDKDTGVKTIDIEFMSNSSGWTFEAFKGLGDEGPLKASIGSHGKTVTVTDDTDKPTVTSGSFGVTVSKGGVDLYCDPDWDNR